MKRFLMLIALALIAPVLVRADGTADILLNPASTTDISAPGSYRLAGGVAMTANVSAITISADNVTLDLNGHMIAASPGNSQLGVNGLGRKNVTLHGGTVTGFGMWGIILGDNGIIRDCRAFSNNRGGNNGVFQTGNGGVIERCIISDNAPLTTGTNACLVTGTNSRVADNIVRNNVSQDGVVHGIFAGSGSVITNNALASNSTSAGPGVYGIFAGANCVIRGNTVTDSQNAGTSNGFAYGIYTSAGCHIEGNTCSNQAVHTTVGADAIGIFAEESTIINNDCRGNVGAVGSNGGGVGILGSVGSLIRGNRCEGNIGRGTGAGAGIVVSGSSRVEDNFCRANGVAGSKGWGIRVFGSNCLIIGNSTQGHSTAGMVFLGGTTNNRAESNRMRETTGIDTLNGNTPASLGAGDLANVVY